MFQIEPLAFTKDDIRAEWLRDRDEEELEGFDPEDIFESDQAAQTASDVLNGLVSGRDYVRTLDWTIVADSDGLVEGLQWGIVVNKVVFGGSFRESRSLMPETKGLDGLVEIVEIIQSIVNYDIERVNEMVKAAA